MQVCNLGRSASGALGRDGPGDVTFEASCRVGGWQGLGKDFLTCPNCRTPIEKDHGCNHMTCRCNQHFCAVCGKVGHAFALLPLPLLPRRLLMLPLQPFVL